jgi:hypothetical protein
MAIIHRAARVRSSRRDIVFDIAEYGACSDSCNSSTFILGRSTPIAQRRALLNIARAGVEFAPMIQQRRLITSGSNRSRVKRAPV